MDQIFYAVPVSDFLSEPIRSVQLDTAAVKNRLGMYSTGTITESCFWDNVLVKRTKRKTMITGLGVSLRSAQMCLVEFSGQPAATS